jgi:hypothetical protein
MNTRTDLILIKALLLYIKNKNKKMLFTLGNARCIIKGKIYAVFF